MNRTLPSCSKGHSNASIRNKHDFCIPIVKSIKIGLLPPHNFPKIWYEHKQHFSKLSNINLNSNFKQNLIEDFISRTNVLILTHAMFAKEATKAKA